MQVMATAACFPANTYRNTIGYGYKDRFNTTNTIPTAAIWMVIRQGAWYIPNPFLKDRSWSSVWLKAIAISTAQKTTYDYNRFSGKFDQVNDRLSNDYENSYGYNSAGIRWRMQLRKFNASAGVNWQQAELEGNSAGGGQGYHPQ